jgi:hypothetical protein
MLQALRIVMLLVGLGVAGLAVTGIVALVRRRWAKGFWFGVGTACGGFVDLTVCAVSSKLIWQQGAEEALGRPYDSKVVTCIDTMSSLKEYVEVAFLLMVLGVLIAFVAMAGRWTERRRSYEVDQ